jgi:hypothetical protein
MQTPPTIPTSYDSEFLPLYTQQGNGVSRLTFVLTLLVFIAGGLYLKTVKPPEKHDTESSTQQQIETRFMIQEKKHLKKVEPIKKVVEQKQPAAPIDLTKAPVLKQKTDDVTEPPVTPDAPVVRRVYGVRRVFSTGLGAGGEASDAVIGKKGNSLNVPLDTVMPTNKELHGQLAPISTVTSSPRLKKFIKPEYSQEMLDAKVQGFIRADILIDVDGKVKEVKILNDLGHGTAEKARAACFQLVFDPAMRGNEPVAVWVRYTIQFVLLND